MTMNAMWFCCCCQSNSTTSDDNAVRTLKKLYNSIIIYGQVRFLPLSPCISNCMHLRAVSAADLSNWCRPVVCMEVDISIGIIFDPSVHPNHRRGRNWGGGII